jgi:hypothetical protein
METKSVKKGKQAASMRDAKSEKISISVSPAEKLMIEKAAEKSGCTTTQFIRGQVFTGMAMEGNIEALKYVSAAVFLGLGDKARSILEPFFKQTPEPSEPSKVNKG